MRFRKSRFIFVGFLIFFLGYFSVNYIGNKKSLLNNQVKADKLFNIPPKIDVNLETTQNLASSKSTRYFAFDGGGFGSINTGN